MARHQKANDYDATKTTKKGISINAINLAFVFVVVLFSAAILFNNHAVQQKHMKSLNLQKTLIACSDAANALKDDSDSLTLCVNTYLETLSADDMNEYFSIIDNQLRELEVQRAEKFNVDCTTLRQALDLSDRLAERETHAFALIANAVGTAADSPAQVRQYQLPPEEKSLSGEEKIRLAHDIIHSEEYNSYKKRIYSRIKNFEDQVLSATESALMADTRQISSYLNLLNVTAVVGNLLVIAMAMLLYRKVTVVLREYVISISRNLPMREKGTTELKYMARVFNKYLGIHNAQQDELRRMADVDSLTGVASRRALEDYIMQRLRDEDINGALVFLDVDDFKMINDTYGHDAGDAVLRQLAGAINEVFGAGVFVGRFGGDEFVIWLDGVTDGAQDEIKEKIKSINALFAHNGKRHMSITVSAGAALCGSGDKYADILKAADNALYEVKNSGKSACLVCRISDVKTVNGEVTK